MNEEAKVRFCDDLGSPLVCVDDYGIATVHGINTNEKCSDSSNQRFAKVNVTQPI